MPPFAEEKGGPLTAEQIASLADYLAKMNWINVPFPLMKALFLQTRDYNDIVCQKITWPRIRPPFNRSIIMQLITGNLRLTAYRKKLPL